MNYFYDKINLLWIMNEKIDNNDIKKFLWHDLLIEFKLCFDHDKILAFSLEIIDNCFLKKDLSFWMIWFVNYHIMNQLNQSNRFSYSKCHEYSWKILKISHFIDKAKNNKFISSKWISSILKSFFIINKKSLFSRLSHDEW